jgi:hypothetical protein
MDPQKLDAALASALMGIENAQEVDFEVFIHTVRPPTEHELAYLEELRAKGNPRGTIFTARLSAQGIDALSERPWVRAVKLSQRLRPLK